MVLYSNGLNRVEDFRQFMVNLVHRSVEGAFKNATILKEGGRKITFPVRNPPSMQFMMLIFAVLEVLNMSSTIQRKSESRFPEHRFELEMRQNPQALDCYFRVESGAERDEEGNKYPRDLIEEVVSFPTYMAGHICG